MKYKKKMNSIDDLSNEKIFNILELSNNIKNFGANNVFNNHEKENLSNIVYGLLFFEPSTRTCLSFESAIHRLKGEVIKLNTDSSSKKKGESDFDTVKTIDKYVDILIIRHPEKGFISKCKKFTNKPIINAGDGSGEHPTQALLDLFTIKYNFKSFPTTIAFTGDIRYSRTIHSLVYLLEKFNRDIRYHFICDEKLKASDEFKNFLEEKVIGRYNYEENINNVINQIDVLYLTRIQKERFEENSDIKYVKLTQEVLSKSKENLIVMHQLPRNDELPENLDSDNKCKYFEQVENGVFVRMAILYYIFRI